MPTFELFKLGLGDKPKPPSEVVPKVLAALQALNAAHDRAHERASEAVSRGFESMKFWLYGDDEHEPTKANVVALAEEVARTDFLEVLPARLPLLDFERRKDAAQVFGAVVRIRDGEDRCPGALFVQQHPSILETLFEGVVLASPILWDFFAQVEVANFEVASDAFSSFKDLLTRHKGAVAAFLSDSYAEFFDHFYGLLQSSNYVTRRQSLKLLGELLLDGINVRLMMRYVSDVRNLMLMMNLLKDSSRSIQFEAFHVFKVFVANPSKPQPIFKEEKAVIIKEISRLGRSDGGAGGGEDHQQQQQAEQQGQEQQQQQQQQQQQAEEQQRQAQQQLAGEQQPAAAGAYATDAGLPPQQLREKRPAGGDGGGSASGGSGGGSSGSGGGSSTGAPERADEAPAS
ncbi:hypothetical protein Rsub_03950 [Raphidocelis subcapitata]|uniref:Calcium-binding protein n=1 Tax=Raphidocelis subcapitata TaxID=307507 RepID=A0A2V0NVI6_9CHLO|nr:hypothetical protein Rsub_03950 [Raphidocelis subcapitata]|eukprot:GBF91646.1 hypothetical protein Rsub_03950 [Raphidocelis subcapitata]